MKKRPDFIPVFVSKSGLLAPRLDRTQFLVPNTLTTAQFSHVLRKRMALASEKTIFLMCGSTMLAPEQRVYQTYAKHKNPEDGFLYVTYAAENAFG